MDWLELTLPDPAENVALDEALLDEVDAESVRQLQSDQASESGGPNQSPAVFRVWEPLDVVVVIGRASRIEQEVDLNFCETHRIPVLRRCSGGAAIVAMPGCLLYSAVLPISTHADLQSIDGAHRFVLSRVAQAVQRAGRQVAMCGTSDLAVVADGEPSGDASPPRKVSGNSLRRKRQAILYHGTLLYNADLDWVARCLGTPPRQPDYRQGRQHGEFVTNLDLPKSRLVESLRSVWQAVDPRSDWPRDATRTLVRDRYGCRQWTFDR